ncbi:MAG: M48 family metallopeptidase [Bacteroidales bacterium]|nr:M48 family metallopeptidase [Bacteroidales bacterium]
MSYSLMKKQIIIPDIGCVSIVKTRINRRISIRVTPRHVRVTIPYRINFDEGEKFLFKNIDWVINKFNELRYKFNFYDSQIIPSLIGKVQIFFQQQPNNSFNYERTIEGYKCHFGINLKSPDYQKYVYNKLMFLFKKEALPYLQQRTYELAQKHNLIYSRVRLSSAISRWGSCSYKNSISLNYRLIFLPQEMCDYVILHELAHTVHKNHSKAYWEFLESIVSDCKKYRQQLKQFRLSDLP